MGYYEARIEDARFTVPAEQQQEALGLLLEMSRDEFGYDLADHGVTSLSQFLKLFGYDTVTADGDIVGIEFEDRFLLESEDIFRALGPYVEAGSFVLLHAGTGQRWRYVFDGQGTGRVDEPNAPWYGS